MFDWKDDKSRLHVAISINYNSGNGLKVNDIASNVGQGWNLMAGGSVTRMQVGEPDDQYPNVGDGTIEDEKKYPAGNLYNPNDVYEKGCPKSLTRYPLFEDKNHIYKQHNPVAMDRELDYFAFSFNGKTGLFVLNKYDDSTGYMLGNDKVVIKFKLSGTNFSQNGRNIRTRVCTFTIQDEDGLIYRFGTYKNKGLDTTTAFGLSKALRTGYCDPNRIQVTTQPRFKSGNVYYESLFDDNVSQYPYIQTSNPYIINTWYLTEIEDTLTNRRIVFSYDEHSITKVAESNISYYKENDYSIISRRYISDIVKDISKITCHDQYSITFQYSGSQRVDLTGEYALASVAMQSLQFSNRYLSKYELKTSYFLLNRYGTPASDFEKGVARLCLTSIKKYSVDLKANDPPYLFDYYLGSDNADDFVPPPFFVAKDIWGFYNGNNSTAYDNSALITKPLSQLLFSDLNNNDCKGLCFLKNNVTGVVLNAKNGYAKNGLLKQIVYPTGGTLNYTYEQNKGIFENESTINVVGGVHVSQTSSTDGGYSNDCNNPIVAKYDFINSGSGTSSLWGIERPTNTKLDLLGNQVAIKNHYHPEEKKWSYTFPFGKFGFKYQYPGILSKQDANSVTWHQQFMMVLSQVLNIVSIVMQIQDIINVILGPTPLGWVALIIDIIGGLYILLSTLWANPDKDFYSTVYYNSDLNGTNPLPAQYRRVEIIPNTGDIGKTVETFTSPYDDDVSQRYPFWIPENPNFLMHQRYAAWVYGLPRLITTYDASGFKIKEIENIYDTTYARKSFLIDKYEATYKHPVTSCNCQVLQSVSQRNTDWSNSAIYDNQTNAYTKNSIANSLNVFYYWMYTGELQLKTTYERTFKTGNSTSYLETETNYEYKFPAYRYLNASAVSKITTVQSNGKKSYRYLSYSGDYLDYGDIFKTFCGSNMYYIPVESEDGFQDTVGPELTLHEQVSEFTRLSNGNIQPSRTLEQRFFKPQASVTPYLGTSTDYSKYKQTQTFYYSNSGNIVGIEDEGNHIVANIYDYLDKFIVASVVNADLNIDKPAYSSFETSSLGGWVLTGVASYSTKSITGSRSFILSSGVSLKALGLNTTKPYKFSFWATSSAATVAATGGNATLFFSGPTYNGLTYYEYNITQGVSAITLSGNTTIDELRLYPKNSRMRSTTYDPLIGKTSECDENNRIIYYEYDDLTRLKLVKDENKNIVKMYEYNITTNQSGCPGTYSNHLITELFTKNNCTIDYVGNPVTYIVPAGQFTSTISQADADQKAQDYLNANGQINANNNGNCSKIFYNNGKSQSFITEGCAANQVGGSVNYTVPSKKYTSITSQNVVDSLEQAEIDANGQANANRIGRRICTNTAAPNWQADSTASTKCQIDTYGSKTGHIEVYMTDANPNSTTYNTKAWKDAGLKEDACPHDEGAFPCLVTGQNQTSGHGVRIYAPGTVIFVKVTLNSSDPNSKLTGNISGSGGGQVSLNGAGTQNQTFTVTVPVEGYISWNLILTNNVNPSGYICSNIQFL